MTNLIIDKELEDLIRPLTEDEFEKLKADIMKNGVLSPLIVSDGVIVDGHNRYKIATSVTPNLPFTVREMKFENRDQIKLYMGDLQIARRNLSAIDRLELASKLRPSIEREAARHAATVGASNLAKYKSRLRGDQLVPANTTVEEVSLTPEDEVTAKQLELEYGPPKLDTLEGFELASKLRPSIEREADRNKEVHQFVSKVPVERSPESLKHDMIDPYQPAMILGTNTVVGDIPKAFEKIRTRKEVAKFAKVGQGTVERYDVIKANAPEAIDRIKAGDSSINKEYQKIVNLAKKEEEKNRDVALAEKTKDLDLGAEIEDGVYSKSGLLSQALVNLYDDGLEAIARVAFKTTKYCIILAAPRDTYKVPDVISASMNRTGIVVLDTPKGIRMAHVFGQSTKLPEILRGEISATLPELLKCVIKKGDIVVNPYPVDGAIALAIKAAGGIGHIFTGGNKDVETIVRAALAPKEEETADDKICG